MMNDYFELLITWLFTPSLPPFYFFVLVFIWYLAGFFADLFFWKEEE